MNFEEYLNEDLKEKNMINKIGSGLRKMVGVLKNGDRVSVIMDKTIPLMGTPKKVEMGVIKQMATGRDKKGEDEMMISVKLDNGKTVEVESHRVKVLVGA